ncbi:pilus assembly protein [Saezia sanguinis]|uniref:pilus assembly protein n=1 Tax=Saezia sanguinis TaxID=1965230 RepID=UPI00304771ED
MKTINQFFPSIQTRRKATKTTLALLISAQMITMPFASYAQTTSEAEPAQTPLVASRTMASPNIMLIFDDSGSMGAVAVPDSLASTLFTNNTTAMMYNAMLHPDDRASNGSGLLSTSTARYVLSTATNDYFAAMGRSPQVNKLYYNPASTYSPWLYADGTPMPTYSASAAPIYAVTTAGAAAETVNNTTIPRIDLTFKNTNYTFSTNYYCGLYGGSYGCTRGSGRVMPFTPAIYFIYKGPDAHNDNFTYSTTNTNIRNINNYNHVIVADIPSSGLNISQMYRDAGYNTSDPSQSNYIEIKRTDCTQSGGDYTCSKEQEFQNFANWYVYYRGRARTAIGALSHVFARDYGMRFRLGWANLAASSRNIDSVGTYSYVKQGVRPFEDAFRNTFYKWLFAFERGTSNSTPTLSALYEVGTYYSQADNRGPWGAEPGSNNNTPHLACRKSYTLMVTDGGWNESALTSKVGNADNTNGLPIEGPDGRTYQYIATAPENRIYRDATNSGSMADVAMYFWNRDLRPTLANEVPTSDSDPAWWQHMTTYTIGFGVKGDITEDDLALIAAGSKTWPSVGSDSASIGRIDDLYHAAINGHGEYASASDVNLLIDSLAAMMESMAVSSQPSPHIVLSSDYLEAGNTAFAPSYVTGTWTGDLSAYKLASGGGLGALLWNASSNIPTYANRNIWIGTGGADRAVEFQWSSLSSSMRTALQAQTLNSAEDLVKFLRGDNTYANNVTFRQRSSVLGDIVNSNPLYVKDAVSLGYGALSHTSGGSVYSEYHSEKANRAGIVFIGANDGMLHAFATDGVDAGKEVFAFIPNGLLSKLGQLASLNYDKNHRYYVDGYLTLTDANLNGCSAVSCWRNVLLGSAGAGGKTIFALDVTDPNAYAKTSTNTPSTGSVKNTVLWELTPDTAGSEMGFVMQPIQAGYTRTGDWVGIFGNGPYSDSGQAYLYVVNLKNGSIIQKIATDSTIGNGLMGVTLVRNSSQIITGAYAGDLKGRIWYFDLSSQISASNWSSRKVFTTQNNRPITQAPALYPHPNGGRMVLFGTGKFYDTADTGDTGTDAIYGVWDRSHITPTPSAVTYNELLHRSWVQSGSYYTVTDATINWTTQRGWDLPLTMEDGQRSLYTPTVIGTDVVFDTSLTTMDTDTGSLAESCEIGGIKGISIIVNLFSGGLPSIRWDTNGDGVINDEDGYYIGYRTDSSGPSYIGYNPGLGSGTGGDALGVGCPNGYVGMSVGGVASCKKAFDTSTWTQMF